MLSTLFSLCVFLINEQDHMVWYFDILYKFYFFKYILMTLYIHPTRGKQGEKKESSKN